jgi:hypothetical protein
MVYYRTNMVNYNVCTYLEYSVKSIIYMHIKVCKQIKNHY